MGELRDAGVNVNERPITSGDRAWGSWVKLYTVGYTLIELKEAGVTLKTLVDWMNELDRKQRN